MKKSVRRARGLVASARRALVSGIAVGLSAMPLGPVHAQWLINCPANYFLLSCRSPLPVVVNVPYLGATFTHNSTAAGALGDSLAAGSCAFSDRPLRDNEPINLLDYLPTSMGAQVTVIDPVYNMMLQCSATANCVLQVCVQNGNDEFLHIWPALGQTFIEYPSGGGN